MKRNFMNFACFEDDPKTTNDEAQSDITETPAVEALAETPGNETSDK